MALSKLNQDLPQGLLKMSLLSQCEGFQQPLSVSKAVGPTWKSSEK
jgi:hypothetical protein